MRALHVYMYIYMCTRVHVCALRRCVPCTSVYMYTLMCFLHALLHAPPAVPPAPPAAPLAPPAAVRDLTLTLTPAINYPQSDPNPCPSPVPDPNECPRALLCLVCCAGRAQSCFLTILRIPSALLTRLAPASCTLHPEFYNPYRHLTFSVFSAVIQLTVVVASLHRADVFRVRLGGHCREFGVKPCSNSANFCIRRSQRTV